MKRYMAVAGTVILCLGLVISIACAGGEGEGELPTWNIGDR